MTLWEFNLAPRHEIGRENRPPELGRDGLRRMLFQFGLDRHTGGSSSVPSAISRAPGLMRAAMSGAQLRFASGYEI
jgi:hypothetical protein